MYNRNKKSTQRLAARTLHSLMQMIVITIIAMAYSSCSSVSILEPEEDCERDYYLQFVYDMNMDFADAFNSKIESLQLYIFDARTGDLVSTFHDSGDALKEKGYKVKLELEPGRYEFRAWFGLEDNDEDFKLDTRAGKFRDTECSLQREYTEEGKAVQNKELHALYHGALDATLPDDYNDHYYKMPLTKDTNNINLSIQEISGKTLDPERFTIKMEIDNGKMDFDNSVLEDEPIEYTPYRQVSGGVTVDDTRAENESGNDIVLSELSTSRLLAEHNPVIEVIDNEKGETIYAIPLVKWALMLRSQKYAYMGEQEYLDREDEFNIILYINQDPEQKDEDFFLAVSVMINGWRIVLNDNVGLGQ